MGTDESKQPAEKPKEEEKKPISSQEKPQEELSEEDLQELSGGRMVDKIP